MRLSTGELIEVTGDRWGVEVICAIPEADGHQSRRQGQAPVF